MKNFSIYRLSEDDVKLLMAIINNFTFRGVDADKVVSVKNALLNPIRTEVEEGDGK